MTVQTNQEALWGPEPVWMLWKTAEIAPTGIPFLELSGLTDASLDGLHDFLQEILVREIW